MIGCISVTCWTRRARCLRRRAVLIGHQFDADENLRLALAHLLQIIGEAASRLSSEFRQAHADIPWKAVIGMRHKIVHDYLNVDDDIVWLTATVEMGPLVTQLKNIVSPDEGGAP